MDFSSTEVRAQAELFSKWAAYGETEAMQSLRGVNKTEWQFRAMGVGETTGGQSAVGKAFYDGLIAGMDQTNVIRSEATVVQTDDGKAMQVPVYDDLEVEAVVLPENAQAASEDVEVDAYTLKAHTFHSKIVCVSNELITDGGPVFQRHIGTLLGRRLGRLTNRLFLSGDGDGEPSGLLRDSLAMEAVAPTAITYDELVDLRYLLNSSYQRNAKWLMSPLTLAVVRKIVDDASRPIFDGELLFGRPVLLSEAMPAIAAGNTPIAFGDLTGYLVREVNDLTVRRYTERYAPFYQIGLAAVLRTDACLADTNAVCCLQMAD